MRKHFLIVLLTLVLPLVQPLQVLADEDVGFEPSKTSLPLLKNFNDLIFSFLFFDISGGNIQTEYTGSDGQLVTETVPVPFIITFLIFGGIFFTIRYRFITFRLLKHAIDIIRGRFDDPNEKGEISHFRALTSALSATVGLGNIAGVAVAIQLGGPGAIVWMVFAAFIGMASKFGSCTLSQMYRQENKDGSISGGPMYYLDLGLRHKGRSWAVFGKALGITFSLMIMGGALGGGNMFQVNQMVEATITTLQPYGLPDTYEVNLGLGIAMAVLVGVVILGGIKRIGSATSRIVPAMCAIYVASCLFILITNWQKIPTAWALIWSMAFTDNAMYGGVIGVMVWGMRRAAFSNEAGMGSAAIAHAAAKTKEPVREGIVAMIGPLIDTVLICSMTATVIVITGAWNDPSIPKTAGVALTTKAFESAVWWFTFPLTACVILFAYSTMISWFYYGERGWIYFMDHFGGIGLRTAIIFRLVFVGACVFGAVNSLVDVINFSDAMILSCAFPNILGSLFLSGKVRDLSKDYEDRYHSGEMVARNLLEKPAS